MSLDPSELVKHMLLAAKGELGARWPEIQEYAQAEAQKLAHSLVMIESLKLAGKINKTQATLLLDMQKQTSRAVLLTIEGLSLLAAEAAINAALRAVSDAVNTAIGWKLL